MPEAGGVRAAVERLWYGERAPGWLRPAAWLYGRGVALRRALYARGWLASHGAGVPVVVVGNLVAGGTGKTPLVIWLATQLAAQGVRVGVALRGHGGRARGPLRVDAGSDPRDVGDEAVLIARRTGCPVAVARRRPAAARLLADAGCRLVVCDDGLQHLALRADFAIVVIDGARGFGNGALLPAGPLREPVDRLAAADCVVLHGPDQRGVARGVAAPLTTRLVPEALVPLAGGDAVDPGELRGQCVHAVAGIGHPGRFFDTLRSLGAQPLAHPFADHHVYRSSDLAFGDTRRIVMTEKDAVKCRSLATPAMWFLQVSAGFEPGAGAALLARVRRLLD